MAPRKILLQLDPDTHASSFDAVVAVDAGVDQLLQYAQVELMHVQDLVYGAIFTRGGEKLKNTAIFIGGRDVVAGEELLKQVTKTFFGPMRVSVMLDANGANTTAAAAVVAAASHMPLAGARALVLAGTGAVGRRVCLLLAQSGAEVCVGSRSRERAAEVCESIVQRVKNAQLRPVVWDPNSEDRSLHGAQLIVAAGAAGTQLLPAETWQEHQTVRLIIDLNAVPPLGVGGVESTDRGQARGNTLTYGALGIGGLKMKIHRAAIARLFESNDQVLDAAEIFRIGTTL